MSKMMPIGIQDFKSLRESGYLYIDKTKWIYPLLPEGHKENAKFPPYFLSRPRRFGKSLLVSTIRYLFEGEKELFEGLWIHDKWNWNERYPVVYFSLGGAASIKDVLNGLEDQVNANAERLGVSLDSEDVVIRFRQLLRRASEKEGKRVVLLIDEYDRPILDTIEDKDTAKEIRDYLRRFYSEIKTADEYLKFVLLTGVSRFSRAGIFSGLNNLKDISLDPRFGNIVGITQAELEEYLAPYINECGGSLEEVKEWYNGYNFLADSLYNPFDVLKYVDNGCDIQNYWFESGTPKFLIKVIEMGNFYLPKISNLIIGRDLLDVLDVETIRPEVLLFQAGYLTIDEVIREPGGDVSYRLRIPNKEVRRSLSDRLLDYVLKVETDVRREFRNRLCVILENGDIEGLKEWIQRLFNAIPYHYHTKNEIARHEGYYASVLFAFFSGTGLEVRGEDVSRVGRADITVFAKDKIYIVEIKTDADEPAIKQIKERKYHEKYLGRGKKIYLVGINISSKERRPKEVIIEEAN